MKILPFENGIIPYGINGIKEEIMLSDFHPGDSVKINCDVYANQWDGWEELFKKYGYHNGQVDRIINMEDIEGSGSMVVVGFPYRHCKKIALKPSYLTNTTIK